MKRQNSEENDVDTDSVSKPKRCLWTEEEDKILLKLASNKISIDWHEISKAIINVSKGVPKTSKQCRERWHNRVNPLIKQCPWSFEESTKFFELYQKYGSKWSKLAQELPGRTDNTIYV